MELSESSEMKTTKVFSMPLLRQTIRSNNALTIAVLVLSCLLCFVISFAMGIMGDLMESATTSEEQTQLLIYLMAFAQSGVKWSDISALIYNADGTILSAEQIAANLAGYENVLAAAEQVASQMGAEAGYSIQIASGSFDEIAQLFVKFDNANTLTAYVSEVDYEMALAGQYGALTGSELSTTGILMAMIGTMGIDMEALNTLSDSMSGMNASAMIDTMFYHEIGLLPMLIWIVVVGNSVIASQVDRGSMAYVLSTPTRRSAVVTTQALYLVGTPFCMTVIMYIVKILANYGFTGSADAGMTAVLFLGMYFLVEAMCGICFFGSCFSNRSGYAMAFGGAFVVWFFIAAIVGMFGMDMMVQMGMGAEALNVFNYLTLMSLLDIDSIYTVGTEAVSYAFLWKFVILIVVSAAMYIAGALRFMKKDLPL